MPTNSRYLPNSLLSTRLAKVDDGYLFWSNKMEHPKNFPSIAIDSIEYLPKVAGIYFAMAGDTVLYVGQSEDICTRWKSHHKLHELIKYENVRIHFTLSDGRSLYQQETEWISLLNPILNTGGVKRVILQKGKFFFPQSLILLWISFCMIGYFFEMYGINHSRWDYLVMALVVGLLSMAWLFGGLYVWIFGNIGGSTK